MTKVIHDIRKALFNSIKSYKNNIALKLHNKNITYQELLNKSYDLLKAIERYDTNIKKIGILTQRTEAAYICVACSILYGFTYVPLNPKLPAERLKQIVEFAEIEIIATDKMHFEQTHEVLSLLDKKVHLLIYEDLANTQEIATQLDNSKYTNDIIYLLFTSGSTGTPKGVPINNVNLCAFLNNINKIFDININDSLSQTFDLSFDLAMFDILVSWLNGATLCVMTPIDLINPIEYIIKNKISVWFSVPSLVVNIKALGKYKTLDTLKISIFCGEALHQNEVLFWHSITPNSSIHNIYGPTEATIACSHYKIIPEILTNISTNGIIPIGNIFTELDFIILDENYLKLVNDYEIGELCIKGAQVFDGYIGVNQNPFVIYNGYAYYKTGDLVKKNKSGILEYVSRNDGQVKINGFRIELGEIEHNIKLIKGVQNAIVVITKDINNYPVLSAFVKGTDLNAVNIKILLEKKLPKYMIPRTINLINEIPLNINGKIDRKALALI